MTVMAGCQAVGGGRARGKEQAEIPGTYLRYNFGFSSLLGYKDMASLLLNI